MRKFLAAFLLAGLAALSGCGGGDEQDALRIALLVEDAGPELDRVFEEFRAGLEAHIGMPVQVIEGATHLVGIEAMRAGNLDVMWGSPFVYLLARNAMEVERLAVTENPDAINRAVIITARDDIRTLDDLRGRSFAFISPASASGYMYPLYHMMNHFGLSRDEMMAGSFFSAVAWSGGHNAGIMGVVRGDYDAAAVGNLNLQSLVASGMVDPDDFRIIAHSEIIPFPGYIAAGHLPRGLRDSIREFILAYDDDGYFLERFGDAATRFVMPDPAAIEYMASMAEALEIDLAGQ